jgi:phosphopantetheinyl transferase
LVALEREVGIDLEDVTRETDTLEIVARFFSAAEVATLRGAVSGSAA